MKPPTLGDYALLYTATETGTNSGIRFAMSRKEAMAWCSHPMSQGVLHGTRWSYFWTGVETFMDCHWGVGSRRIDITGLEDNGLWDDRIAGLGLTKISIPEFAALFGPLGVTVVRKKEILTAGMHAPVRAIPTPAPLQDLLFEDAS